MNKILFICKIKRKCLINKININIYVCIENIFMNAMAKEKDILKEQNTVAVTPVEGEETPSTVSVTETATTVIPSRSREWMKNHYPDAEWADDDAFDGAVAEHLTATDEKLKRYVANDEVIGDLIDRNPEFGLIIQAMHKGMPFEVALRRYMGNIFGEEVDENEPNWEELKKASDDFLAEKRKNEDEIATRTKNLEASDKLLTDFVERNFPTEEEQVDFVEYLRNTLRTISMGELTEAFFDMILKAYKHDSDVEDAKEAGAIEARNEKITAKRIKANTETDGMPMGGGTSPIVEEEEPEEDDFLGGVLRDYNKRRK